MAKGAEPSVEVQLADARLAALRQDPRVIVRHRTTDEPYEPVIQVAPEADILELLGRREPLLNDGDAQTGVEHG